ncbi:MAG: hypothetical protein R2807_10835 [Chitinophagales bacterium]
MKNLTLLLLSALVLNVASINARPKVHVYHKHHVHYVKVKPANPIVVNIKPVCPSPKHVWIEGDWIWSPIQNQYVYTEGRWVIPAGSASWVPGHWKHTKYGWNWIEGHWKI